MTETLVLKTDKEPTFFNKEAAIGFFLAPVIGTIIGGVIGIERMKREKTTGKVISDNPSFWNKDTLLGGLIGLAVGALAGTLLLGTAVAVGTLSVPALAAITVAAYAVPVAGALLGGYYGGTSGQEEERAEFAKAKTELAHQASSSSRAPDMSHDLTTGKNYTKRIEQERALAAATPAHTR